MESESERTTNKLNKWINAFTREWKNRLIFPIYFFLYISFWYMHRNALSSEYMANCIFYWFLSLFSYIFLHQLFSTMLSIRIRIEFLLGMHTIQNGQKIIQHLQLKLVFLFFTTIMKKKYIFCTLCRSLRYFCFGSVIVFPRTSVTHWIRPKFFIEKWARA